MFDRTIRICIESYIEIDDLDLKNNWCWLSKLASSGPVETTAQLCQLLVEGQCKHTWTNCAKSPRLAPVLHQNWRMMKRNVPPAPTLWCPTRALSKATMFPNSKCFPVIPVGRCHWGYVGCIYLHIPPVEMQNGDCTWEFCTIHLAQSWRPSYLQHQQASPIWFCW